MLKWKSPYYIWQYLIVMGIYYMGWLFHKIEQKLKINHKFVYLLLCILFSFFLYLTTRCEFIAKLQPRNIINENAPTILLVALIGCSMVYSLAKVLNGTLWEKILAVVGNYSFSIMLLHFLAFKVVNFIQCLVAGISYDSISDFPVMKYDNPLWFLLYVLVGVALPIIASWSFHTGVKYVRSRCRSL